MKARLPHTPMLILLVALAVAGCDRLPGMNKTAEAPPPAPAPMEQQAPSVVSEPVPAGPAEPSLEARSHLKQGFSYIVTAKNARDAINREENLNNALNEFSQAILKEPGFADAYSNRAVAYMQQGKFNKAQEDLNKARELAPDNAGVRYNLASLYSLKGDVDLALDEIDATLARGFNNYDALRTDPDLANARKHPEFRKILERHKVFIIN
jgi:tetratricopeptide (TPR) repeat protein